MEEWKDISGYEGLYQISNTGRVKHLTQTHANRFGKCKKQEHSEKIAAAYQIGLANKEEQMMKDAISCNVIWHDGPLLDYTQEQQDNALEKIGATIGDRVRIIIVKEA